MGTGLWAGFFAFSGGCGRRAGWRGPYEAGSGHRENHRVRQRGFPDTAKVPVSARMVNRHPLPPQNAIMYSTHIITDEAGVIMIKIHLSGIKIFESFSEEELGEVAGISHKRKFPKNSHLFRQGEEMAHFYFIIRGNVKVYRIDRDGREQIVNFFGPGEMLPHHAIFRTDPYPANAGTTVESEIISIAKEDFESLLHSRPDISIKMFKYLGNLIVDLQNRLQEKILKPTDVQLLSLLLRLSRSHGEETDDSLIKISMRLTKQEMASMIGLTRETVSRNLSAFKMLGLITENREGFITIDTEQINTYLSS